MQVVEYRSDDRDGPPAHTHEWDEVEYVIEGHVEFLVGGTWTAGGPGTVQMLPRGVPHSVRVPEGDARVLMMTIGPPYDQFARELSEVLASSGYADPAAIVGVAERHGVRLG